MGDLDLVGMTHWIHDYLPIILFVISCGGVLGRKASQTVRQADLRLDLLKCLLRLPWRTAYLRRLAIQICLPFDIDNLS